MNKTAWGALAVAALGAGIAVSIAVGPSGPGNGISGLAVGTGYDASQHVATGQAADFAPDQNIYVVFTVQSRSSGPEVEVSLLRNGSLEGVSLPIKAAKGRTVYDVPVTIGGPGIVTIEVSYNGAVQQTMQIKVG